MSIQTRVKQEIDNIGKGIIFSYTDLPILQESPSMAAVSKAISRLVLQGDIKRASTGKFYRPNTGLLAEQYLSDSEKLNMFLYKNGKRNGYITGILLFNRLGLTTQLPKTYVIAANQVLNDKDMGTFKLKVIKSKAPVTEENVKFLEILDCLNKIKSIPDSQSSDIFFQIRTLIQNLPRHEIDYLTMLTINYYPPAVRALLGLCLSSVGLMGESIIQLKQSINPLTSYRLHIDFNHNLMRQASEWNIK